MPMADGQKPFLRWLVDKIQTKQDKLPLISMQHAGIDPSARQRIAMESQTFAKVKKN
jgi:hypothetical protein